MRKTRMFHAYGPKVICWREPPDDPALNSRCLEIQMVESNRTNVGGVNDPRVKELAAKLQAQLLQFRFENYMKISIPLIAGLERLKPRSRETSRSERSEHCVRSATDWSKKEVFFAQAAGMEWSRMGSSHNAPIYL